MTLLQLRLISAASLGSISAAAKKLGLSQPNASQSIKSLEKEFGYDIFNRNEGHAALTEQGHLFLDYADAILREDESIRAIDAKTRIPRLRVGVIKYTPAVDVFLRFAEENCDEPLCDLTCINVLPGNGMELLRKRELDIIVTPQIKSTLSETQRICKANHFSSEFHKEMQLCVRVRSGHPLVQNGKLNGSMKGFSYLKEYPYAEYRSVDYFTSMLHMEHETNFGCSYKIYADERETRLNTVRYSNAYSIGIELSDWRLEKFGLKSFPIGRIKKPFSSTSPSRASSASSSDIFA